MKRLTVLILAVAAGALMLAMAVAQATEAPAEDVLITVPDGAELKMNRVNVPHAVHAAADIECMDCHHMWDESDGTPQACAGSGCHDLGNPATTEEKQSMAYFRNAFHAPVAGSCNGCHKERKDAGESHGPTSCNDCHTVE